MSVHSRRNVVNGRRNHRHDALGRREARSLKANAHPLPGSSSKHFDVPSPTDILCDLDSRGFSAVLESSQAQFKAGRKQLLQNVTTTYAIAFLLRDHPKLWAEGCCQHDAWSRFRGRPPAPDKPETALGYVMRLAIGSSDKMELRRASKFTIALQKMFDDRVSPDQVPGLVKAAGGLEKLARDNRRSPRMAAHDGKVAGAPPLSPEALSWVAMLETAAISDSLGSLIGIPSTGSHRRFIASLNYRLVQLKAGALPSGYFVDLLGTTATLLPKMPR